MLTEHLKIIAFYNNILKAELDGTLYNIGQPVDDKVELNPIKGKTGTYTESYYDSDPTDGDYDFDVEQRMKAEDLYDKGEQAYLEHDLVTADKYYQAALKAGGWLGWGEEELPPYSDNESINESKLTISGTDKAIKMLKSELGNNNVKFETEGNNVVVDDSPKAKMAVKMVKEREGMQSIKLSESKKTLKEAKDEKGKWTNANGKDLYSQFKEIDNLNGQEVLIGLDWEMEENHELTKAAAAKIVIKNLKKNPIYYTMADLAGKKGAEAQYMSGKSANPEAHQMQYLDKNMGNVVDKKRGMQPVKGVEKAKKDSDKGGEANKPVKNIKLMSLIAKTVRGMKKMDATGEKMKKVSVKENKEEFKPGINYNNLTMSDQAARAKKIYDEDEKKRKEKNAALKTKLKEIVRQTLKEYEIGDENDQLSNIEIAQAIVDNLTPNLEGDTFTESELQDSFITVEDQMGQRFDDEVFDLAIELLGQDGYTLNLDELFDGYDNMDRNRPENN